MWTVVTTFPPPRGKEFLCGVEESHPCHGPAAFPPPPGRFPSFAPSLVLPVSSLSVSLCVRVCLSVWAWRSVSSCQSTCTPEYHLQSSTCSTPHSLHSSLRPIVQFPTVVIRYSPVGASLNSSSCFIESCLTPCFTCAPGPFVWFACSLLLRTLSSPTDQLISALFSRLCNKSFCLEHSPKTCLLSAFGST